MAMQFDMTRKPESAQCVRGHIPSIDVRLSNENLDTKDTILSRGIVFASTALALLNIVLDHASRLRNQNVENVITHHYIFYHLTLKGMVLTKPMTLKTLPSVTLLWLDLRKTIHLLP